jgi:hypothetical protein
MRNALLYVVTLDAAMSVDPAICADVTLPTLTKLGAHCALTIT